MATPTAGPKTMELRSIDWIPPKERHGSPVSLFFLWFAANSSITALVTGGLFVLLGNSALWSIPAIIIGNLIGGFITALHSAQGPQLGVPQMIQSRAQFGYYGAILPLVLALIIYIGFYATGLVLGGQALATLLHVSVRFGAIIFAVFSTVLAIAGYKWIHKFSHAASVLSGIVFILLLIIILGGPMRSDITAHTNFALAPFILGISLSASWQLTFGPYIADYSRYLPESTSQKSTIGWTFAGSFVGATLAMTVGAFAAQIGGDAFSEHQVGFLSGLAGSFFWLVLLAVVVGKLTGNTLSSYGGFMSLATIVTAVARHEVIKPRARSIYVLIISLFAVVIALLASDNFVAVFTDFLMFLLYFMTPWSAINLVDYYLVRHKKYDVDALFQRNGPYGTINKGAFVAYFAAVLVQVPFMNSSLYVGPVANLFGGAEIAWLIGLVVAGGLYLLIARIKGVGREPVPSEDVSSPHYERYAQ
ncbi:MULTISPECIES: purine-cytosine permease family protein [Micrococcaceae]|uniref:purine-cytosine permease family protein n=1 Tax=unclassified Kocuria TaxID=2649579 RepID=UPI001011BF7B|nr:MULTISPECIES: cytosine permease [unclassified Kocuria]